MRKQNEARLEMERQEKEKRDLLRSLESNEPAPKAVAPKQMLTPLISPAALIAPKFPPKIFSPAMNSLAIQRAKEKVMQLKAQKLAQHQQFMPKTIAQTAVKGTGRVAHVTTTTSTQVHTSHSVRLWAMQLTRLFFFPTRRTQSQCLQFWKAHRPKYPVIFECSIII